MILLKSLVGKEGVKANILGKIYNHLCRESERVVLQIAPTAVELSRKALETKKKG